MKLLRHSPRPLSKPFWIFVVLVFPFLRPVLYYVTNMSKRSQIAERFWRFNCGKLAIPYFIISMFLPILLLTLGMAFLSNYHNAVDKPVFMKNFLFRAISSCYTRFNAVILLIFISSCGSQRPTEIIPVFKAPTSQILNVIKSKVKAEKVTIAGE
jgi:hypothetical protein